MPDIEKRDVFAVCINKDGKFLLEGSDGGSTWNGWVDNILIADRFAENDSVLHEPSYYKTWPKLPDGCRMMWVVLSYTAWLRGGNRPK